MIENLRIVMCGCHEYGYHLTRGLLATGLKIDYFVILNPAHNERYQISGFHYLADVAAEYGIPVYEPHDYLLTHEDDLQFFADQRFDLLIQGGWQRLFPAAVIESLSIGAIGVHGSADFLPKGRGRSPLNWSLIQGETRFLLQLFLMKTGADDGDIFDWEQFDINGHDTIQTLYHKNIILTKRMLLRSIPRLENGTIHLRPQTGRPSYFEKRTPQDGAIDWEVMNVYEIHNLIRATTRPYPGAFGMVDGALCRIWRAQVFDTRILYPDAEYGAIVERFDNIAIINCRRGLLLIEDWEPIKRVDKE